MEKERYVTERALAAVSSPSYGVICPYFFTIALAENAIDNGVEFMLDAEVVEMLQLKMMA
jgi:glycerol-3-phosphate dehydrogenase